MDDATKLIEAVASFIGAFAWPLMVLLVLLLLARMRMDDEQGGTVLQRILARFATDPKLSVKVPGVEVTTENFRDVAQYAVHSTAAEMTRSNGDPIRAPASIERVADQAAAIAERYLTTPLTGARVLWVDPAPAGNLYERRALEALGIEIDLAQTTEEAVEKVRENGFRLIISNWTRPGEDAAALNLLDRLGRSNDVPVVIYAGKVDSVRIEAAAARGAYGYTTLPTELFDFVTRALQQSRPRGAART